MSREEYMRELQEKLGSFDEEVRKEILSDYEEHFFEGRQKGKTDYEIIQELGDIDEMISELKEMVDFNKDYKESKDNLKRDFYFDEDKKEKVTNEYSKEEKGRHTSGDTRTEYYVSECDRVVVNAVSTDIVLEKNISDKIVVEYNGDKDDAVNAGFYQYVENGTLYVGVDEKKVKKESPLKTFLATLNAMYSAISIQLPDNVKMISVTTKSGDLKLDGITMDSIKYSTLSGDIELNKVKADELEITTTSGDIDIHYVGAHNMNMSVASGDIDGEDINGESLYMTTGSGDISLTKVDGNNISAKTGSGDIGITVAKNSNTVCETGSGDIDIKLVDSTGIELNAKTGIGDVSVRWDGTYKNIKNGKYIFGDGVQKIDVKTGTGDINIVC